MHDRGEIKWAPFNSVINGKYLMKNIEKEKSKIPKPLLSDEQIENIENIIKEAYINKVLIEFTIYKGGFIKQIKGLINNIEPSNKKILLENHKYIYFCEIINVRTSIS